MRLVRKTWAVVIKAERWIGRETIEGPYGPLGQQPGDTRERRALLAHYNHSY